MIYIDDKIKKSVSHIYIYESISEFYFNDLCVYPFAKYYIVLSIIVLSIKIKENEV